MTGEAVQGYHPPLSDLEGMTFAELAMKQSGLPAAAATPQELVAVEQGGVMPFDFMDIEDGKLRDHFVYLQVALDRYDGSKAATEAINEVIRSMEERDLGVDRTLPGNKYATHTARTLWATKRPQVI